MKCRIAAFGIAVVTASLGLLTGAGLAAPGLTERVSVSTSGAQANGLSDRPTLSADGRFVAFEGANASNLVPNDTNNVADVFVRDRQLGSTERISVDSAGVESNNGSAFAAVSADGRFVAFQSIATNLVPSDTNNQIDVFVHDRQTDVTSRVSVTSDGSQATIGGGAPAISADGRYVAFLSNGHDLIAGDTNGTVDIFVHDRQTGTTTRVSVDSAGGQGNGQSIAPALSSDGGFVAFVSEASNLVAGDTNGVADVFVHDLQTGAASRVSLATGGGQGNGLSGSAGADHDGYLSADGRFVAFSSAAANLVAGDTNGFADVFVHDRQTGVTSRVSVVTGGGQSNGESFFPTISGDGRFVAFGSLASNLVTGDTNGVADVFVNDRQTGATSRVSVDSGDVQGNGHSPQGDGGFEPPAISSDGSLVAFGSFASNLVPGDTNGTWDIFAHQLAGGVGGMAQLPDVSGSPLKRPGGSGANAGVLVGVAAGVVAALGGAAWVARRRRVR
jgi:Tol biopolymer transport system component